MAFFGPRVEIQQDRVVNDAASGVYALYGRLGSINVCTPDIRITVRPRSVLDAFYLPSPRLEYV